MQVFPSANHTRLAHSLGVALLTCRLVRKLAATFSAGAVAPLAAEQVAPTQEDLQAITMAALCHDIAHGPFSHLWEIILAELGVSWCA